MENPVSSQPPALDESESERILVDSRVAAVRLWRPLMKKPPGRCSRVLMLVGREDCEGFATGAVNCYVAVDHPDSAYRYLWAGHCQQDVTPEEVLMDVDPAAAPQRMQAAAEAQDWFVSQFVDVA